MTVAALTGACGETDESGPSEPTAAMSSEHSPTTPPSIDDSALATIDPVDRVGPTTEGSIPRPTALDARTVAPSGDVQSSPHAVVEAYYEAADANDADAMLSLVAPQRREGVAPSDWADCLSDRLADISGAEVDFEHVGTSVEDGSTFVEAVITLSESGEGAVPSDEGEILAVPTVVEVVETDGLWWTVDSTTDLLDSFACL